MAVARRLGLARIVVAARGRQSRRRACVRPRLTAVGRPPRPHLAARRRGHRRALRAKRGRPPRRALRRSRPVGMAPLLPDTARRRRRLTDERRRPHPDGRARPARRGNRPGRGRPLLRQPVVRVGSVPERARLGHACARTTRKAATPGTASLTTTRARGPTAGTRTAWPASPTSGTSSALRSRSGTVGTRSSRSGCSGSRARRATTARMPRSTGGTSRGSRVTRCCAGATTTRRWPFPTSGSSGTAVAWRIRSSSCSTSARSTRIATGPWT